MRKILFHVSNLVFIPLFIGLITILCQEWYEGKREKQKAIFRICSVKNVYDNFLEEMRTNDLPSGSKTKLITLKEKELFYIALIHIQEELLSVRKENEILPYLSEYTRNHLSKFALEIEREIKRDYSKLTEPELDAALKIFVRQQYWFKVEIDYVTEKISERELEEKLDAMLYSGSGSVKTDSIHERYLGKK